MNAILMMGAIEEKAEELEALLSILANRRRLIILCNLITHGELAVGELMKKLDLAQSALSQHLALMRSAGIVETRREGTTIYYSLTDEKTRALLYAIRNVMCTPYLEPVEAVA